MAEAPKRSSIIEFGKESPEELEMVAWKSKFRAGELEIPEYIKLAEWYLELTFGVENLSFIEKWWLKKITEKIIPNYKHQRQLLKNHEILSKNAPTNPSIEIASMWLNELYGIDSTDGTSTFGSRVVIENSDPKHPVKHEYPYIPHLEDSAWERTGDYESTYKIGKDSNGQTAYDKMQQLKVEGKHYYIDLFNDIVVSKKFKLYLQILREKSQILNPEEGN